MIKTGESQLTTHGRFFSRRLGDETYVLPPQFIFHNQIYNIPPSNPFGKLSCLWRVVLDRFLVVSSGLFESEETLHFLVGPQVESNTADEG